MKLLHYRLLILLIPIFLFLTFVSGLMYYIVFIYLSDAEIYSFGGNLTATSIIFSGFMGISHMLLILFMSTIYSFVSSYFLNKILQRTGRKKIILNALLLTLLINLFYLLYKIIQMTQLTSKFWVTYYINKIPLEAIILTILFLPISILLTYLYYKSVKFVNTESIA